MIAWDRGRIAACTLAGTSLVVHLITTLNIEAVLSHAIFLLLPLSVIFWPEYCDRAFRESDRGRTHSTTGPTPAIMVQIAGWILLLVGCWLPLFGPPPG
ncbi:hypothetical protein C5Y96_16250 [Blastopirellula marina]|uniref:Uncharacterized protein n=1 Tax=Blastopirellula marina TaxID=124 RepID=A0A2S8F708_9BACT|nr:MULTISPECIES: hypothetical protein [Pirellulaceae]PQO27933.1 hypothetical protein C5Y96_16250 [Blastopirellula marina]RCS48358.1 hypothetical protein DTL36_16270 [Bremerella cremea]